MEGGEIMKKYKAPKLISVKLLTGMSFP